VQEAAARASRERLEKSGRFNRPVVTEISPAQTFWRAEEYHQQYLARRGLACRLTFTCSRSSERSEGSKTRSGRHSSVILL
jgi:peptide methionine sulfoxide reductase MsrA